LIKQLSIDSTRLFVTGNIVFRVLEVRILLVNTIRRFFVRTGAVMLASNDHRLSGTRGLKSIHFSMSELYSTRLSVVVAILFVICVTGVGFGMGLHGCQILFHQPEGVYTYEVNIFESIRIAAFGKAVTAAVFLGLFSVVWPRKLSSCLG